MRHRFMIALLGLLLIAGTAGAVTLNVPTVPYPTIQAAVNAANNGDTILVADGNYIENVTVNKNIILKSENGRAVTTITGVQDGPEQGAIYITPGSNGVQIGSFGHGFKIIGLDGPPAIERAAIYLQQNHTNMIIQDNEIYANGDEGLLMEYDAPVSYITIDSNVFSGRSFTGAVPGGEGFGGQFSIPNVPRQLVVIGGGATGLNTNHITFTNNQLTGIAGGYNSDNHQQGTFLATIDADHSVITGNTFHGTTTRYGANLRCRRLVDSLTGNNFLSDGLTSTCLQLDLVNNGPIDGFLTANTFDKGVYVAGGGSLSLSLQAAITAAAPGTTINVLAGNYLESLAIGKSVTILGPNSAISPNGSSRVPEAVLQPQGTADAILATAGNMNVSFKGITFDMAATTGNDARFVEMINMPSTTWFFERDIFTHGGDAINGNWYLAGNNGPFSLTLNDNYFTANASSNGIALWSSDPQTILITNNRWEDNATWAMNFNNVHGTISGNTFRDTVDNGPEWYADQSGLILASANNDVNLINNVFDSVGFLAVNIYHNFDGVLHATGNTFTHFEGAAVRVRAEGAVTGDITDVFFDHNSFLNNTIGIQNLSPTTFHATCNWWGTASGPAPAILVGPVDYTPWLDGPPATGVCGNNTIAVTSPTGCLTPAAPCSFFTVAMNRTDDTPVRGVSITFDLSEELELCSGVPATDIAVVTGAGSWLGLYSAYDYFVTPVISNPNGTYTVDMTIRGLPCGPQNGGNLFTVHVKKSAAATANDSGSLTVISVQVRDCDNGPLPATPGAAGTIAIDQVMPVPVSNLATNQVKTGNDTNGTTKINVTWTASASTDADYVQIYRKGFGSYPEYDDASGSVPADLPPSNGWALAATVDAGIVSFVDEPATRDFWYYRAIVVDACGNPSAPSDLTAGTLNYHLGDVTPIANGDNDVDTQDISYLGDNYGVTVPLNSPLNHIDVGPTTNFSVNGRPLTDSQLQFEDLIMFAINYGVVSKDAFPNLTPAAESAVIAKVGEVDPATSMFRVEIQMSGDGRVQGLSVPLTWNNDAVQPVDYSSGNLIADQGGVGMVLCPAAGTVDAAIFGVRDRGICGVGTLATVTFKVVGAGDPGIALGQITARDSENQPVEISGELAQPAIVVPIHTELYANTPNPFNPSTVLSFSLSHQGNVQLKIYSVQGRLVATLVDGELAAGPHSVTWQGRDDAGRLVSSGAYIARLEAPDATQSRRITLMK